MRLGTRLIRWPVARLTLPIHPSYFPGASQMTGAVRMVPSRRRDQPDRYTHVNVPKKVQAVSRAAQRRCSAQPRPPPELWVWSEPPDASMYEHGGVAIVRTNPPRVRGIPLGPISQCIDTKWGNGFGTSLRKYRIRPSAGRPIRGIRKIKYVKYARLSKRTARCGTDLNTSAVTRK